MTEVPNRMPCVTEDVGPFAVSVSFMPDKRAKDLCGAPVAVFLSKRAKTGSWLDDNQREWGIVASKLMQHEYRNDG